MSLIDLQKLSIARYAADGQRAWAERYSPRLPDGSVDTTHLNSDGGFIIGRIVAEQLAIVQPELRSHLMVSGPPMPRTTPEDDARVIRVDPNGGGDYPTVQQAIDSVRSNNRQPTFIHLAPGEYHERVTIPRDKPFITLVGDDPATTVLTWHWNADDVGPDGYMLGTGGAYTVEVNADDFRAENITFRNTAGRSGQALALSARGDRHVYRNCRMLGYQDTLYVNGGRQYFVACYIEGAVDFIFGGATAVFDRCTIHSVASGYIAAPSTPQDQLYGLMFFDCALTGSEAPTMLARPWRAYGMAGFVRCVLGEHIAPAGWNNWRNPENETTARFLEYASTGPGAMPGARVKWARQLTPEQAETLTIAEVLRGSDDWRPLVEIPTAHPGER
ncbi:MAG TPA: pectinesterase family protein [Tepidisphaeraceae bacterium]|nr:pectinesterase family protein [Tepidisphaeraceae bacterium]